MVGIAHRARAVARWWLQRNKEYPLRYIPEMVILGVDSRLEYTPARNPLASGRPTGVGVDRQFLDSSDARRCEVALNLDG